jgi:hypothetical protein
MDNDQKISAYMVDLCNGDTARYLQTSNRISKQAVTVTNSALKCIKELNMETGNNCDLRLHGALTQTLNHITKLESV